MATDLSTGGGQHHLGASHRKPSTELSVASPESPWPMVPFSQTLTVMSDGEEEFLEQKFSVTMETVSNNNNNNNNSSSNNGNINNNTFTQDMLKTVSGLDQAAFNSLTASLVASATANQTLKRKVGRPITSPKTMNRLKTFPAVDDIREKLETGDCYVRPRASTSCSDVWELFQEVAFSDSHQFTGIVQCKSCKFLTRYHGQITGTSHMRRHQCFSLLFPNSTPVNRKIKTQNGVNGSQLSPNSSSTLKINVDADSTTPKNLKKLKKEHQTLAAMNQTLLNLNHSPPSQSNTNNSLLSHVDSFTSLLSSMNSFNPNLPQFNVAAAAVASATQNNVVPKKRTKVEPRSLMTNNNGTNNSNVHSAVAAAAAAQSINSIPSLIPPSQQRNPQSTPTVHSQQHQQQQQQQHHHHQSQQSAVNSINGLALPASIANNLRIQNSKKELTDALVEYCCNNLVGLQSCQTSAFQACLRAHLNVNLAQLQAQLGQQFSNNSQFSMINSAISKMMNHKPSQMPDQDQMESHLKHFASLMEERIQKDLGKMFDENVPGALVFDSDSDNGVGNGIISAYYIDSDWQLVEAVLAASSKVTNVNQFVAKTMDTYSLKLKKLSKFTFVSHGGHFDGVTLCLSSMAHVVDKVVEESLSSCEDYFQKEKMPSVFEVVFDACANYANKYGLKHNPISSDNERSWIDKLDLAKIVLNNQKLSVDDDDDEDEGEISIDYDLLEQIINLLEPLRSASFELRRCSKRPTLPHVLLYFYKLKNFLSTPTVSKSVKPSRAIKREQADDSEEELEVDSQAPAGNTSEEEESDDSSKVNRENELAISEFKKNLLENLYQHYEVVSFHRIATFLWPNFRFLKMLSAAEQKKVHEDVRKMLQTKSEEADEDEKPLALVNSRSGADSVGKSNDFNEWEDCEDMESTQDEVDRYLSVQLSRCGDDNLLQWWKEHESEFPKLSKLARSVLAIPASVTTRDRFRVGEHKHIDDLILFLHCNMQNDAFTVTTKPKVSPKGPKIKNGKGLPNSSFAINPNSSVASLMAQANDSTQTCLFPFPSQ